MNAVPDNGWDAVAKFDRAIAGTQGAFPYTSDNERIHEIIRDAGKHGLTLFWLKSVWASRMIYEDRMPQDAAMDHYRKICPWAVSGKHGNWQEKYRFGWTYSFEADTWADPSTPTQKAGLP